MQQVPGAGGAELPGAGPQPPDLVTVVLLTAALVGLVLLSAVAVALARRFLLERQGGTEEVFDTARLLAQYDRLREQGQLSEEEYRRIRARLLGQAVEDGDDAHRGDEP